MGMDSFQEAITAALFGVAAIAVAGFVLLVVLYWRKERRWSVRERQTQTDITDMTILFQTMRDVIAQQKTLARDFNQELERKMDLVKQVLAVGIRKNEELYERQKALQQVLDEAQERLQSLQVQLSYVADATGVAVPKVAEPERRGVSGPVAPEAPQPRPPRGDELPEEAFARWLGEEPETAPAPEPEEDEEAEVYTETPEDIEANRAAFRALMDNDAGGLPFPPAPELKADAGGNGGGGRSAIQRRVLEYSEAGMSVAQIAREFGIGRGEVRLMLSLGKRP